MPFFKVREKCRVLAAAFQVIESFPPFTSQRLNGFGAGTMVFVSNGVRPPACTGLEPQQSGHLPVAHRPFTGA